MAPVGQVEQRQQRQRPGRIEDFPGHPVVRLFVGDRGHEGAVAVIPFGRAEPGLLAGRALPSLGPDQHAAFDPAPVAERYRHAMFAAVALNRFDPARPGDRRFFARCFEQRQADVAVGIHPAQGPVAGLGLEIDPAGLHPVGHRDCLDRTAQRLEPVGQADVAEQVPAGGRDRRGAPIDPFGGQLLRSGLVDHVAGDPLARGGQGQRHADQPAAKDDKIALLAHCPQVFPSAPSRSRQRPSKLPSGTRSPRIAARVGAMSTVSTGWGCSKLRIPLRQNRIGTRRS